MNPRLIHLVAALALLAGGSLRAQSEQAIVVRVDQLVAASSFGVDARMILSPDQVANSGCAVAFNRRRIAPHDIE